MTPSAPASGSIVNALTVDVEDYFHVSAFAGLIRPEDWDSYDSRVVANTERLLALFERHATHATFFVLGWVAERQPALVRRIAEAGHEIASHSYAHQLVYDLTPDQFREDLAKARQAIGDACGRRVVGFRAPSYSVTARSLWALDVLLEEGYEYDASIFPIRHDRYGIPGAPRHPFEVVKQDRTLLEVPPTTVQIGSYNLPIAGGGYFRQFPYALTKWGIARVNDVERRPVAFYLHPWEVDPDQPRLGVPMTTRVRHYRNLARTEARLDRLLRDFRFDAIERVFPVTASSRQAH